MIWPAVGLLLFATFVLVIFKIMDKCGFKEIARDWMVWVQLAVAVLMITFYLTGVSQLLSVAGTLIVTVYALVGAIVVNWVWMSYSSEKTGSDVRHQDQR